MATKLPLTCQMKAQLLNVNHLKTIIKYCSIFFPLSVFPNYSVSATYYWTGSTASACNAGSNRRYGTVPVSTGNVNSRANNAQ